MNAFVLGLCIILSALSLVTQIPLEARSWIAAANLLVCAATNFVFPTRYWPPVVSLGALSVAVVISIEKLD